MLRRVERDAEIGAVLLSIYYHRPADASQVHPLKNLARDLVFSAQRVGHGLDLEVERFKRKQDEEKKRNVMGQPAWRVALVLGDMLKSAESQRDGKSDTDLLSHVLSCRLELAKDWRSDTCDRYLWVATKVGEKTKQLLTRWELAFQRSTFLDGITLLRAAATANTGPDDFHIIVVTL